MYANLAAHRTRTFGPLWRYGPLLLWMIVISFASTSEFSALNTSRVVRPLILWLFPGSSEERVATLHFLIRKLGHLSEYFVLGILAGRAFAGSVNKLLRRRWFQIGLSLIICYALVDEFHQSFVPGRTASIYDSAIDTFGGLSALLSYHYWQRRRQPMRGDKADD